MVPVAQVEWEFDTLLQLVGFPARILEIGVWHGGTLKRWLEVAETVVAIDTTPPEKGRYGWVAGMAELHYLQGDSHNREIVAKAAGLGPYDLIFIDADHSLTGVTQDWNNYRPMLAPGGCVVFHDILPRPEYGVSYLWSDLKQGARTVEIVAVEPSEHLDNPNCGLGVIWP